LSSQKRLANKTPGKVNPSLNRQKDLAPEIPAITEDKAEDGTTIGPKVTG
jgi:hypothetical protein